MSPGDRVVVTVDWNGWLGRVATVAAVVGDFVYLTCNQSRWHKSYVAKVTP